MQHDHLLTAAPNAFVQGLGARIGGIKEAKGCTVQAPSGHLYLTAGAADDSTLLAFTALPGNADFFSLPRALDALDSRFCYVAICASEAEAREVAERLAKRASHQEDFTVVEAGHGEPKLSHTVPLIVDESRTFARCGRWFASTGWACGPDIVFFSVRLSAYCRLIAVLANKEFVRSVDLAVFERKQMQSGATEMQAVGALQMARVELPHAEKMAVYLEERLRSLQLHCPQIVAVETMGLSASITFAPSEDCTVIATQLLQRGVVVTCSSPQRLELAPPLLMRPAEIDVITGALRAILFGWPSYSVSPCTEVACAEHEHADSAQK